MSVLVSRDARRRAPSKLRLARVPDHAGRLCTGSGKASKCNCHRQKHIVRARKSQLAIQLGYRTRDHRLGIRWKHGTVEARHGWSRAFNRKEGKSSLTVTPDLNIEEFAKKDRPFTRALRIELNIICKKYDESWEGDDRRREDWLQRLIQKDCPCSTDNNLFEIRSKLSSISPLQILYYAFNVPIIHLCFSLRYIIRTLQRYQTPMMLNVYLRPLLRKSDPHNADIQPRAYMGRGTEDYNMPSNQKGHIVLEDTIQSLLAIHQQNRQLSQGGHWL